MRLVRHIMSKVLKQYRPPPTPPSPPSYSRLQKPFSSFSSNKAGVGILFNNKGRCIICEFKSSGKTITFANIYAPNEDDPTFFKTFPDHVLDFQGNEIIFGGDFRLVPYIQEDKEGGLAKIHRRKTVCGICKNLDLGIILKTYTIVNRGTGYETLS